MNLELKIAVAALTQMLLGLFLCVVADPGSAHRMAGMVLAGTGFLTACAPLLVLAGFSVWSGFRKRSGGGHQ